MQKTSELHASAEDHGKRLDQFVVSKLDEVSRARIQQLIERDKIEVDGRIEKASYRIQGSEVVRLLAPAAPRPLNAEPEDIPLDIVFEDDSIAVVNKPAGMMVHAGAGHTVTDDDDEDDLAVGAKPTKDPRTHGTLVNALLYRFEKLSKEGGDLRPGIVHRLDKDTSGLIVVAKTDKAHRKLAEQFSQRTLKKKYIALVHGWPKNEQGTIDEPIGRDRSRRHRMSTRGLGAREAVSHYAVLKRITSPYGKFALLEVTIETGRTHQIRVHLASIGNTVVGDTLYGAPREINPPPGTYLRAKRPADTKATRDRASSDLARMLTLEATGDLEVVEKNRKTSRSKKGRQENTQKKATNETRSSENLGSTSGAISLNRNFLHASAIEFSHPATSKRVKFERELPAELDDFLERLAHLK
jgi:23S rRNA pseudouridine1911/1915/1917 synthase